MNQQRKREARNPEQSSEIYARTQPSMEKNKRFTKKKRGARLDHEKQLVKNNFFFPQYSTWFPFLKKKKKTVHFQKKINHAGSSGAKTYNRFFSTFQQQRQGIFHMFPTFKGHSFSLLLFFLFLLMWWWCNQHHVGFFFLVSCFLIIHYMKER